MTATDVARDLSQHRSSNIRPTFSHRADVAGEHATPTTASRRRSLRQRLEHHCAHRWPLRGGRRPLAATTTTTHTMTTTATTTKMAALMTTRATAWRHPSLATAWREKPSLNHPSVQRRRLLRRRLEQRCDHLWPQRGGTKSSSGPLGATTTATITETTLHDNDDEYDKLRLLLRGRLLHLLLRRLLSDNNRACFDSSSSSSSSSR